jgi:hypothetical protein
MAQNKTGLPDKMKSNIENISGTNLDHVRVHYNSSVPSQQNKGACTQGNAIFVAPGQQHLVAHEAWHVVQQTHNPQSHVGLNQQPEALAAERESLARRTPFEGQDYLYHNYENSYLYRSSE